MIARRIALIVLATLAPLASQTTTFAVSDHLPLAVGNSWTYEVWFYDHEPDAVTYTGYRDSESKRVTLTILKTEVLDGETYYVFSDMPTGWPPAPVHSVAGKKLRWNGNNLTEHNGTSSFSVLQFREGPEDGSVFYEYTVSPSEADGNTKVKMYVAADANGMYSSGFDLRGGTISPFSARIVRFITGYGMTYAQESYVPEADMMYPTRETFLRPVEARLASDDDDARRQTTYRIYTYKEITRASWGDTGFPEGTSETSTDRSSWGQVKERDLR